MADQLDITEIISEFGSYYKDNGQGVKDIRKKLMIMSDTDKLFYKSPTKDTQLQGGNVEISDVLQAYQDTFTPMGDTTFTTRKIDLYPIKVDWERNPTKIWNSWLGFLASESVSRKDWPIIRYIIDNLILNKMSENWELKAVFGGSVSAVTPGTALDVSGAVNGIKKLINASVTAGDTTPITLGAVPTDPVDFVDYMEAYADAIPEHVKPFLQQIAMSQTLFKRFRKGMRTKYNMNYAQAELTTIIDTNLAVEGFRSHEGSTKVWTTIKGNAVLGIKNPANERVFKVEEAKRMVSIYTDFWKGIGFWQPEYIYTNDVDLS